MQFGFAATPCISHLIQSASLPVILTTQGISKQYHKQVRLMREKYFDDTLMCQEIRFQKEFLFN